MGCGSAKSGQEQRDVTPATRRHLSLGSVGEDDEPGKGSSPSSQGTDEDRSMLLQLNTQQVLKLVNSRDGLSEHAGDAGMRRSFTVGTMTDGDMHRVESFKMKTIKAYGQPMQPQDGIGFACKKGQKPESPNQDSFFILKVDGVCSIYGVFDGHGRKGHDVSNFIKENLPKILLQQKTLRQDPLTALSETFAQTQRLIVEATRLRMIDATQSGSTVSVIYHDHTKNVLHVAHVGDSRCVLGQFKDEAEPGENWTATDLTVDHKPNDPAERRRIEAGGGRVVFDGGWNYRVYAKNHRGPGLNMSRAMGDLKGFWHAGISATPDISSVHVRAHQDPAKSKESTAGDGVTEVEPTDADSDGGMEGMVGKDSATSKASCVSSQASLSSYSLAPSDKFLLLCSDGVWEFLTSEEAVRVVSKFDAKDAMKAADHLTGIAWDRWIKELQGQVVDDITAVVVNLQA